MTLPGGSAPYLLSPDDKTRFPPVSEALLEPDGLLAIGGDLSQERLLAAYRQGIFPWYCDGQPILWWSPNPRTVLFPSELKISRSLKKTIRKQGFTVTLDTAFADVVSGCAAPRKDTDGTWITHEMMQAYTGLHNHGYAHSVEVWKESSLVGGLYGVSLGRAFFGESMFSRVSDASKLGFAFLVTQLRHWEFGLVDCQVYTPHLGSLGARVIDRNDFISMLDKLCEQPGKIGNWAFEISVDDVIVKT